MNNASTRCIWGVFAYISYIQRVPPWQDLVFDALVPRHSFPIFLLGLGLGRLQLTQRIHVSLKLHAFFAPSPKGPKRITDLSRQEILLCNESGLYLNYVRWRS